jgi:RNA polymerase sigma factor (sigma-70 family)
MQTQEERKRELAEMADGVLVQRALTGDQQAFETLVHRYKASLFHLIYHYVREYEEAYDVLQQVWLQLYLSLAMLHQHVQLKPWLFKVARNRCIDVLRRRHLTYFSELEVGNDEEEIASVASIPDWSPTPEELVQSRDLQHQVQRAIQALPHQYRSIVWLHYEAELSFREIGQVLNIPTVTVKTRFYRAKPFLRTVLAAHLHVALT